MEMDSALHIIKSFATWQKSRRDAFNVTKPDRMLKIKIPETNPQYKTYLVKNASVCKEKRQRLK